MTGTPMSSLLGTLLRLLLFAVAVTGLALIAVGVAQGPRDWVELAVIALAVVGACLAIRQRGRRAPRRSHRIRRTSESDW